MKMNEIYEAPELEVVNVMIEKGFAGSYTDGGVGLPGDGSDYDDLK